MTIRTQLKTGRAGWTANHNEALQVRSAIRAGKLTVNHNETSRREAEPRAISMRWQVRATGSKLERLELLVVRAGLRAGRAVRERNRRRW